MRQSFNNVLLFGKYDKNCKKLAKSIASEINFLGIIELFSLKTKVIFI